MITTQAQLADILEILDDSLLALAKQLKLPVGIQSEKYKAKVTA